MIQDKEMDVLKKAQELFYLRELVASFNLRSEPETAKKPLFLKSHWKRCLVVTLKMQTTGYKLILVDTS